MAVTATFSRNYATSTVGTTEEYCTAALSGTYATGGFTWNPFAIAATKGSSPVSGTSVLEVDFYSPLGYNYITTVSGQTATTKILSGTTEFTNGSAVPDASVNVTLVKRKI